MKKPPLWFYVLVAIALFWNVAGLLAVLADVRLTPSEIASMPSRQQALYAARPVWSVVASVIAVAGGTAGCLGLLLRQWWSTFVLCVSLIGIIVQDLGLFIVAGLAVSDNAAACVMQGMVFLIAVALIWLAIFSARKTWWPERYPHQSTD